MFLFFFLFVVSIEVKSPGKMVPINPRRDSLLSLRPFRRGRYFDRVSLFCFYLLDCTVFINCIVTRLLGDK